jgi:hypothetical protein
MNGSSSAALASDKFFALMSNVRAMSPASRRWRKFLGALPLDPDRLAVPVMEPTTRDFIMCGAPRTGTTLLSAMLVQPPHVITVMEPWDGMRFPPVDLFRSLRASLGANGSLLSGKLEMRALLGRGEVRWTREGQVAEPVALGGGFALGVKWPAYWRLLSYLPHTKFLITLRNPYDAIASFRRQGGRLRMGLEYETAFNRVMNDHLAHTTSNLALRRIRMFDYIHERIVPYLGRPNVLIVRYERWFNEPDTVRREIAEFLDIPLREGPAQLRRRQPAPVNTEERELIRSECRTAAAIGYDLDA